MCCSTFAVRPFCAASRNAPLLEAQRSEAEELAGHKQAKNKTEESDQTPAVAVTSISSCPGRGSNPYAPCGAPDFKSGASASSATQALFEINYLRESNTKIIRLEFPLWLRAAP